MQSPCYAVAMARRRTPSPLSASSSGADYLGNYLQEQYGAMRAREAAALAGETEALHDFRVAVRRSRAALAAGKAVFTKRTVKKFRRRFGWLGEITGPVRDLQVLLAALPGLQAGLDQASPQGLQIFLAWLQTRLGQVQRRLVRALGSKRYARLCQDWEAFLASPPGRKDGTEDMVASRLAAKQIRKAHKRVVRHGKAITPDSPATALHALRIDGKRLRYLIELYQALYPVTVSRKAIRTMKLLQDYLGTFHDLHVQQQALREHLHTMQQQKKLPTSTTGAVEQLITLLREREQQLRLEFDTVFASFRAQKPLFQRLTQT